jgi:hypothetical protein
MTKHHAPSIASAKRRLWQSFRSRRRVTASAALKRLHCPSLEAYQCVPDDSAQRAGREKESLRAELEYLCVPRRPGPEGSTHQRIGLRLCAQELRELRHEEWWRVRPHALASPVLRERVRRLGLVCCLSRSEARKERRGRADERVDRSCAEEEMRLLEDLARQFVVPRGCQARLAVADDIER